jgi:hypothetical protein
MANKIDTVIAALKTQFDTLVTSGVLKAVSREVLLPFEQSPVPALGLALSRLSGTGVTWEAELAIMLVGNRGNSAGDAAVTELIAKVHGQIITLRAAGSAGGFIDLPVWDLWHAREGAGMPLQLVGAVASLRIRVEDPLLTT